MIFKAFWFGISQMIRQIRHLILFVVCFVVVRIVFEKLKHLIVIEKPTVGEVVKKLSYDTILFILFALILAGIMVCVIKLFLDVYDNKSTRLKNIFTALRQFYIKYVVVVVLLDIFYLVLFIIGSTFLGLFIWYLKVENFYLVWLFAFLFLSTVLYGLYTFSFLIFSNYILIDEECSPLQAIFQTIHFSREKRVKLFWFLIRYIILFVIIYGVYLTLFTYLRGMEIHWKNSYYYIEPIRMLVLALIYFVGFTMYVYTYKKMAVKMGKDENEVESCLFSGVHEMEEVCTKSSEEHKEPLIEEGISQSEEAI